MVINVKTKRGFPWKAPKADFLCLPGQESIEKCKGSERVLDTFVHDADPLSMGELVKTGGTAEASAVT